MAKQVALFSPTCVLIFVILSEERECSICFLVCFKYDGSGECDEEAYLQSRNSRSDKRKRWYCRASEEEEFISRRTCDLRTSQSKAFGSNDEKRKRVRDERVALRLQSLAGASRVASLKGKTRQDTRLCNCENDTGCFSLFNTSLHPTLKNFKEHASEQYLSKLGIARNTPEEAVVSKFGSLSVLEIYRNMLANQQCSKYSKFCGLRLR